MLFLIWGAFEVASEFFSNMSGGTPLKGALPLPLLCSFAADKSVSDVGGVGEDRNLGVFIGCGTEPKDESPKSSSESMTTARFWVRFATLISGVAEQDAPDANREGAGEEGPVWLGSEPPKTSSTVSD